MRLFRKTIRVSGMRVLHIISRLNVGGTPIYIGNLAEGLISRGIEVVVATGEIEPYEIEDKMVENSYVVKVPHLRRTISLIQDIFAYLEIQALIRKLRPDVIHTHAFKAGLLGRLSFTRRPMIHTFHGHLFANPEFSKFGLMCIKLIEKLLAKRTYRIVSVGERVGLDLHAKGVVNVNKIQNIPPGMQTFRLSKEKDSQFLLHHHIDSGGKPIIGWLGRLTSVKNPLRLLELATIRQDLVFVVAGAGELQDLFVDHGLRNLHYVGWGNTREIFGSIDILLSTSHNEGMPILLMEAAMAGIPVVANNVGSISEILENGKNSVLCDDEISSYSLGIDYLLEQLTNQTLQLEHTKAGAIKKFSIEAMVNAHENIYRNLANYS